jgi:hypothetical protein
MKMADTNEVPSAVVYDDFVDIYVGQEVYHLHRDEVEFVGGDVLVELEDGDTIRVSRDMVKVDGCWGWDAEEDDQYDG